MYVHFPRGRARQWRTTSQKHHPRTFRNTPVALLMGEERPAPFKDMLVAVDGAAIRGSAAMGAKATTHEVEASATRRVAGRAEERTIFGWGERGWKAGEKKSLWCGVVRVSRVSQ